MYGTLRLLAKASGSQSLAFCLLVIVTAFEVFAQSASTGALIGTVTDPTGAVVPKATITLRNNGTGQASTAVTDLEGLYRFSLLPPGQYELKAEMAGFAPCILRRVMIQISEVRRIPVKLGIQGAIEVVDVESPLLQTEGAALGRVIDGSTIVALPLVNRNYTQILGLTSGTNTDVVDATQLGAGSQEIRANGARSGDNNFMLNGVDANSYGANMTEATSPSGGGLAIPAPDTIQEFKVQNSLYDAQYGRGGGANVIVETKSGTAHLHGNAYYFGRNEALNANNFFANATGVARGEFRRHQPGGALGGPVPWSRKRAFFFVSYQATRDVNAASLAGSVRSLSLPPIPTLRTPAALGAVFAGQTGLFGGVKIAPDGSNINPVALNLLSARNSDGSFVIPSPQTAGSSGVNYTAVLPGHYDEDQFNTNLDVSLTKADQLSTKFFFANTNLNLPFSGASVPGFPALLDFNNRNLAIAHTHIFSAQAINQFRFGFSRITGRGFTLGPLTAQSVGISRVGDTQERSLPQMQVLGAFSLGNATNDKSVTANNNFYFSDTLSLARGKHNLRLGAEIFRNQFNLRPNITDGQLTFLSFPDFLLGLPAGPVNAGGNGTSLSNVFGTAVTAAVPDIGMRSAAAHFFVVDDFKVSPALTLNLGFRLEVNGQQSEAHGRMINFYPEFYVPPPPGGFTNPVTSGFVLADNYAGPAPPAGFPRKNSTLLNDPVQVHPEPRLGFSWRPFPSRDLVIRGGYGIYADRIYFLSAGTNLAFGTPFTGSKNLIGGANAAASLQFPFPVLPPASSFPNFAGTMLPGPPYTGDHNPFVATTVNPAFREATVQQYGLEVQQQYKSFLISLGYAGAKSTHLPISRSNNQSLLASPAKPVNGLSTNSAANAVERVPFLGLEPIAFRLESSGSSNYNSLQAAINKRLSHGLQILAAYTFSKSIDTAGDSLGSAAFGAYGSPIFGQQVFNDQHNLAAQRGPSDFDRTHRFVLSYIWNLPQPVNRNNLSGKLAQGWAFSGVVTLQSGLPFSIYDSAAGTLFGTATTFTTGSLAPGATLQDAIKSGNVSSRVNQFFNTSAFVPAALIHAGGLIDGQFPVSGDGTVFGSLGRNILRGPDQHNFDAALIKRTKLTEQVGIVFRWEAFNVLNHPNFANPASNVSSPSTFGKISALSVNPRIMQYGLKLEF
jgi:carboxypeptidase family protein